MMFVVILVALGVAVGALAADREVDVRHYPTGTPQTQTVTTFGAETVQTYYRKVNGVVETVEVHTSYGPNPRGGCFKKTSEIRNGRRSPERVEPIDCYVARQNINDRELQDIDQEMRKLDVMIRNHGRLMNEIMRY